MSLLEKPNKLLHNGRLSLSFEKRGPKTVLTERYQLPPLRASRELYLNPANPSEATVYLMESSGSLVAGDQNKFKINVAEGADACLIPQAATKIYPSFTGAWTTQNIDVSMASNATLAWKTESIIPFKDAKFRGKTVVQMDPSSSLLWGEILSPGRVKRGEVFEYSDVKTNFQVWMGEECLIYDALLFSPNDTTFEQLGLLEEHSYIGSLWFVSPKLDALDIKELNERLQQLTDFKVGASILEGKAVNVRWLASDTVLLKQEMEKVWNEFMRFML